MTYECVLILSILNAIDLLENAAECDDRKTHLLSFSALK